MTNNNGINNNANNNTDLTGASAKGQRRCKEFHARLTPHRSLGPRGFLIVMGLISLVSFITGLVFLVMGAWPVMGFFGLDVVIIYLAFKLNYRSGRLVEMIDLTRDNLKLTRIHPDGQTERFDFNPYWVRVRLDEERNGNTDLVLYHHNQQTSFARFLNDDERSDFASALRVALHERKNSFGG